MPLGVTAVMFPEIDFPRQIEVCAAHGVTHYTWRPRVIADEARDQPFNPWGRHAFDLTPRRLVDEASSLRRQLADGGLVSFGTVPVAAVTDDDDVLKLHLEGAAAVAAGRVRVAPHPCPESAFDYAQILGRCVDDYGRVVELARPFGLKIVIETHCRSLVTSPALALNVCRHFDSSDLGVIFDINNFMIEGGLRPHLAVAVLRDYIDHCHLGGARRKPQPPDDLGFPVAGYEMCSLIEADQNVPDWIAALDAAGRRVPLVIENFAQHAGSPQLLAESAEQLRQVLASLG